MQLLLQWKSSKYYIFLPRVCSLSSPACEAHAPCYNVACLALPYFYILSHKRNNFREKGIEHAMCALVSSTDIDEQFLILGRIQRDNLVLHVKYPLFLSDFNET